ALLEEKNGRGGNVGGYIVLCSRRKRVERSRWLVQRAYLEKKKAWSGHARSFIVPTSRSKGQRGNASCSSCPPQGEKVLRGHAASFIVPTSRGRRSKR